MITQSQIARVPVAVRSGQRQCQWLDCSAHGRVGPGRGAGEWMLHAPGIAVGNGMPITIPYQRTLTIHHNTRVRTGHRTVQ